MTPRNGAEIVHTVHLVRVLLQRQEHPSPALKRVTHYSSWRWISWGPSLSHQQATATSWLSPTTSPGGLKPMPSPTKRQSQWQRDWRMSFSSVFHLPSSSTPIRDAILSQQWSRRSVDYWELSKQGQRLTTLSQMAWWRDSIGPCYPCWPQQH